MNARSSKVFNCPVIELPKVHNRSGSLTAINSNINVPFSIKRVYYLYDIPGGAERGGHAHRTLHQIIIAASGSFDILLDDGINRNVITISRPYYGVHIVPGIWRELVNFSSGAVSLVLASGPYNEKDYIRSYKKFKSFKQINKNIIK